MASAMITPGMLQIQQEFNDQLAMLQKQKKESEHKEYRRIAAARKLSRDSKEAQKAIEQINNLSPASEGDISGSTDDEIVQEEVIKSTASSPKGKQRATKPINLTPDGGETSSPKNSRESTGLVVKCRSQSPENEQQIKPSKILKLLNLLEERINTMEGKNNDHALIFERLNAIEQKLNSAPAIHPMATTDKRNAYAALKKDWIPTIYADLAELKSIMRDIDSRI